MKFCEIQTNFVKILCFAKFAQCGFVPTLCRNRGGGGGEGVGSGGGGGAARIPPCAPSPLKQIVPISASIYNVFHSVIYNSVNLGNYFKPNYFMEDGVQENLPCITSGLWKCSLLIGWLPAEPHPIGIGHVSGPRSPHPGCN